METKVEAFVAEPLSVPEQGVTLRGVGRTYGSRRAVRLSADSNTRGAGGRLAERAFLVRRRPFEPVG